MRDSGNPDLKAGRKKRNHASGEDGRQRRRSIIGVTVSVVLLAAILLLAFFVTPILARQTSGQILPGSISSVIIESGNAKIEMGSRTDTEVIQYFLTGSAEMKWKVDGETLMIRADEGTLRVSLPKDLALSSLQILSTSKDIELNDVDAERIELINSGDDIRIWASDSVDISATAKGSIEYSLSSSRSADFSSDRNIDIKDSTLSSVFLRWNDDTARIEDTYLDTVKAESFEGKLELGITNGISRVTVNGEEREVLPADYLGAEISFDTGKGDMKALPGSARIAE